MNKTTKYKNRLIDFALSALVMMIIGAMFAVRF